MLSGICVILFIARNLLRSVAISFPPLFCKPYVTSKRSSMSTFVFPITFCTVETWPSTENSTVLVKGLEFGSL